MWLPVRGSILGSLPKLGRDYKNVYKDVRELCEYGLLEKDEKGEVNAPYDQIVIRADLRDTQAA